MISVRQENHKKVIVGMSGGVDSTVSAAILKQQGFEVIGAKMKLWKNRHSPGIHKNACYGPGEITDIVDAQKAAKKIGIRHIVGAKRKSYLSYPSRLFPKYTLILRLA